MKFETLLEKKKITAGLLAYKYTDNEMYVFLAKPGGPHYINKDLGSWDIPKGGKEKDEDLETTAKREFFEEIGVKPKLTNWIELGNVSLKNKDIHIWAVNDEPRFVSSNKFSMEWPPKSGNKQKFPEIETAKFFHIDEAKKKVRRKLLPFLERLERKLK